MSQELIDRVQAGVATFQTVLEENAALRARVAEWEKNYQILKSEEEFLRNQLLQAEARLQYYTRHSIELRTQMEAAISIIVDGLRKSNTEAAKPRLEELERQIAADPAPKFLTEKKDAETD